MRIQDILRVKSAELVEISAGASIREAAAAMSEKQVGMLVVLDARGSLVGCLSERDVVRSLATQGEDAIDSRVEAAMAKITLVAHPNDSITELMREMTDKRARHVLVMSEGTLVGVVSIGDILKSRIAEKDQEADVLRDIARLSLVASA